MSCLCESTIPSPPNMRRLLRKRLRKRRCSRRRETGVGDSSGHPLLQNRPESTALWRSAKQLDCLHLHSAICTSCGQAALFTITIQQFQYRYSKTTARLRINCPFLSSVSTARCTGCRNCANGWLRVAGLWSLSRIDPVSPKVVYLMAGFR